MKNRKLYNAVLRLMGKADDAKDMSMTLRTELHNHLPVYGQLAQRVGDMDARLAETHERVFGGDHTYPIHGDNPPVQVQFDQFRKRIEDALGIIKDLRETIANYGESGNELVKRFDELDKAIGERLDELDVAVADQKAHINKRCGGLNAKLDSKIDAFSEHFSSLEDSITAIHQTMAESGGVFKGALDKQHTFACELADRISALEAGARDYAGVPHPKDGKVGEARPANWHREAPDENDEDEAARQATFAIIDLGRAMLAGWSKNLRWGSLPQDVVTGWMAAAKCLVEYYKLGGYTDDEDINVGLWSAFWTAHDDKPVVGAPTKDELERWNAVRSAGLDFMDGAYERFESVPERPPRWSAEYFAEKGAEDVSLECLMYTAYAEAMGFKTPWAKSDKSEREHWRAVVSTMRNSHVSAYHETMPGLCHAAYERSSGHEVTFNLGAWSAAVDAVLTRWDAKS